MGKAFEIYLCYYHEYRFGSLLFINGVLPLYKQHNE